jgi:Dual specificity phosphatase, catalytic domain
VLVHCFGGRSRSAAFIAAYLMCHCGWSYEHTLKVIVAARPVASVNKGFEKQLKAYALTNFDVYATQQVLLRNRIKALHGIRALNESKAGFTRGSFREGPIGGNKRSWADRDSFCAKALNLADEEQKAIEEEGVEEEEEADGDEDIESEKGTERVKELLCVTMMQCFMISLSNSLYYNATLHNSTQTSLVRWTSLVSCCLLLALITSSRTPRTSLLTC